MSKTDMSKKVSEGAPVSESAQMPPVQVIVRKMRMAALRRGMCSSSLT